MKNIIYGLVICTLFIASSSFAAGFVENGDGTVTDTETGLMWMKTTAASRSWEDAISFCENLSLAGYSDWRLPNRLELQSLVDYTRSDPAINTVFFPDTRPSFYWSSTTYVFTPAQAWDVVFDQGRVSSRTKSRKSYVRAVRGGP